MTSALLWFVLVELIGFAAFPLTSILLPRLPDRGYSLAKPVGLLWLTFVNFWLGSVGQLGNQPILLWVALVALGSIGVAGWATQKVNARVLVISLWKPALLIDILYMVGFIVLILVRAQHPAIWHTEKPMDLSILTATHVSTTFPPYDPWLSGWTINYYYGGYLSMGTLLTLTGTAPSIGYNIAIALICGLTLSTAAGIGYALTRHPVFSVFAGLFVVAMGNLNTLVQIIGSIGIFNILGTAGSNGFNFFAPSRITDGGVGINEFPAFSLMLGDLHPHVTALPFALLAIGIAIEAALHAPTASLLIEQRPLSIVHQWSRVIFTAIALGALFFMNSWDYPTYVILVAASWLLAGLPRPLLRESLDGRALWNTTFMPVLAIGALSWLAYWPFHAAFHPTYASFAVQIARTPLTQILEIFGIPLCAIAVGLVSRGIFSSSPPTTTSASTNLPTSAVLSGGRAGGKDSIDDDIPLIAGSDRAPTLSFEPRLPLWRLAVAVVWIGLLTVWPVPALMLGLASVCSVWLWKDYRTHAPGTADSTARNAALIMIMLACAVVTGVEIIHLRDIFSGQYYRMNTVFKFYYQAWLLFGIAAAYALWAGWQRLAVVKTPVWFIAVCVVLVGLGLLYPVLTIRSTALSTYNGAASAPTLDGAAFLSPGDLPDAQGIAWLNARPNPTSIVVEATSTHEYWPYNTPPYQTVPMNDPTQNMIYGRVSVFTGHPTILGWQYAHEGLWHGDAVIPQRNQDVQTIYTVTSPQAALGLLHQYRASYLYVGPLEEQTYWGGINSSTTQAALQRLRGFLPVAFSAPGVTIFAVPPA